MFRANVTAAVLAVLAAGSSIGTVSRCVAAPSARSQELIVVVKERISELARALEDRSAEARREAATELGQIGWVAPKDAMRAPIEALNDEARLVRSDAAEALGKLGPNARSAVPALIELLSNNKRYVRRHAAEALGEIGSAAQHAVPALTGLLKDGSRDVREAARKTLEKIRVPSAGTP